VGDAGPVTVILEGANLTQRMVVEVAPIEQFVVGTFVTARKP
jgi:hypothetical protein